MEKDILSMLPEELERAITEFGAEKYRAGQIYAWLHKKNAAAFCDMTDLPKELRQNLSESFMLTSAEILDLKISSKDNTQKYLFVLPNNTIIESVLMDYEYGHTVCVSSQAGCKMGCAFCASAAGGFHRNLTAGEMLAQVYSIERHSGANVSRVVIMGSGEPFDNFDNTIRFIRLFNSEKGRNIGMRNITVSTAGIVPKIDEFAEMNIQANLAVSLHAPNGKIRAGIMPIERKYPFETLIAACERYVKKTNRRITFEYALIDGANDEAAHAKELAARISVILCHVNLIPVNEVEGLSAKASGRTYQFQAILQKSGISTTVRRRLGADIDGACGQLRSRHLDNNSDGDR